MRNRRFWLSFLLSISISVLFPEICWPQMTLGQYEDEDPFRTWNTFGITTASSLAMGETQFTIAADCSVALSNPALLSHLPRITFTLSSSLSSASFYKYSIVNTGVLFTDENLSSQLLGLDFAGASVRVKNWILALSMAHVENYHRPKASASSTYGGYIYESKNFEQEGVLKNINFSIARKIFNGLSAGFGLNYTYGHFEKTETDIDHFDNITITDSLSHEFKGFFLNGGLILNLTEKIAIAAVFRTPFVKKSDSESLKRNSSPDTDTDIKTEASSRSEYKQPLVVGLGASYTFSPNLKVSSDLTFYNWSKYSIIYFGQEIERERNFKDIIKIGAGIEHMDSFDIFGQKISIPLRAGLSYDPQPMKEPGSSYFYYSFGTGLHWEKFHLDVGLLFGKEKGSGNSLSGRKAVLSLTLEL